MKRIVVRLHAGLVQNSPARREVWIREDATLVAIQEALGVPEGEVALFLVDGELRREDYCVQEGSVVDLYPAFGGG